VRGQEVAAEHGPVFMERQHVLLGGCENSYSGLDRECRHADYFFPHFVEADDMYVETLILPQVLEVVYLETVEFLSQRVGLREFDEFLLIKGDRVLFEDGLLHQDDDAIFLD